MTALERLVPDPGLVEIDVIDVEADPGAAWAHVRHGNLGGSALIRTLFALRALPSRLRGEPGDDSACASKTWPPPPSGPAFRSWSTTRRTRSSSAPSARSGGG